MVRITEELVRKKSEHNELLISTLEELSLHQEDIERIEHLHNWCRDLKILLLQSNLISKIENLYKLKRLEYLNLALNNIERVENLEKLESLNKLDLTLNFIGELTSIENLKDNYNLRSLILTGNPCCDYPNYREFVIATLPQLESLDCQEITLTQKLKFKPHLKAYRAFIIQKQADYAMQRDEQKIRFQQQKEELEAKMASIEDEDERIKTFWDSKSENCPEIRQEIAKYHRKGRETSCDVSHNKKNSIEPKLFAPCGRPYNINKPNLPFTLSDEDDEYILKLEVYKFLDTSHIKVEIEVNYIRVTIKGKIFQIALNVEVKPSEAIVQRSQITGQLVIKVAKLHQNEILKSKLRDKPIETDNKNSNFTPRQLKGSVKLDTICRKTDEEIPDLI
ncbi:protein tilB isoform X1 [Lucilia cuprina]|uniref:protein tilB isoform X1 n=1 Tax=Lucilia cuprina TaxID=7375 RepID=UPI001F05579E|nr:protein tilB isoform X1 [Lucilia cuprina]